MAAACAKALGASKILVADINSDRLQLAKTMGADVIINSRETDLQCEVMRLTNGDGKKLFVPKGTSRVKRRLEEPIQVEAFVVQDIVH